MKQINVLAIYVQHQQLLNDPLTGGSYDTAQYQYNVYGKRLAESFQQWKNTHPTQYPSLPAATRLLWGGNHDFVIHHLGLNQQTDTITPYITTTPPGYFCSQTPNANYTEQLPVNQNGWEEWGSSALQYERFGVYRYDQLVGEIYASEYFKNHLNQSLNYAQNFPYKFDYIIIFSPYLYRRGYYPQATNQYTPQMTGVVKRTDIPCLSNISRVMYMGGSAPWWILLHQYIHVAYTGFDYNVLNAPKLAKTVQEVYRTRGYAPAPWGTRPFAHGCFMQRSDNWNFEPFAAVAHNLTDLTRFARRSGRYMIKDRAKYNDYLVIQSPVDPEQHCILWAYHPDTSINNGSYYNSHPEYAGVWAVFIKFGINTRTGVYYYQNTGPQFTMHVSDNLTWGKGYIPLDKDTGRKAVLLDFETPFGIKVQWGGWVQINGEPTANVKITLNPKDQDLPFPALDFTKLQQVYQINHNEQEIIHLIKNPKELAEIPLQDNKKPIITRPTTIINRRKR